ncbi:MAG: glycerol-3-phosphate 1-O-acyltransferase PlsY [Bauldia sp.]|nr:glycerol-3-phosphate 1-O-acyltransferase PlsY [Bauldia sp.]
MPTSLSILAALAIGYLLGSIPFGLLLTRFAGLGDVRAIGSGNIGATNVLRTGRRDIAAATLVADCLKGTVAVLVAGALFGSDGAMVAGLGAFLGHIFPVWLKFKGGKGVATYLGVLLGLAWPAALIFAVVWIATAWFTRYSSLSALVASLATPLALFLLLGENRVGGLFVVLTVILWWRHGENIKRLLARSESRIGGDK